MNHSKIHKVSMEMMNDRGFSLLKREDNKIFFSSGEKIVIMIFYNEVVNIDTATRIVAGINTSKTKRLSGLILVSADYPSNQVYEQLKQTVENLELFTFNELSVNVTKHELVPKHILLSEKEKKDLLIKYGCRDSDIPYILRTDPVIKYYNWSEGSVILIKRKGEDYYRIVV